MTHTYDITGMHCQSCVQKIKAALTKIAGIRSVDVTLSPPMARVEMAQHVPTTALRQAVRDVGDYRLEESSPGHTSHATHSPPPVPTQDAPPESLYPLILIVGYIAGAVILIAIATQNWSASLLMRNFMAGFFLVFSFFKLLDLRGFADAYRSYDILARRLPIWGWVYPFVELTLGVAYLLNLFSLATNIATLAVMLLGSVGVLKTLLDKRAIRCACLGTALKLPMTKVTLVEDLGMAAMAAAMLLLMIAE